MNHMSGKSSVTQTVARRLQEMIKSGELSKDEKIPSQRILSEQLQVSRASLREALLTLETLGLVRTLPARGTFVTGTEVSTDAGQQSWRFDGQFTISDVFQSRLLIETELCRLAAPHITDVIADRLHRATQQFEDAWTAGDLVTHVEADLTFHGLIMEACPNAMLRQLYQSVRDKMTESQRVPIPNTAVARMSGSISEHRAILEALRQHNPAQAAAAMAAHIRNTAACAGVSLG
ncbi:MAG: GntR family transcriptional repressor for pyruvate dehydrogenase complex [Loktanella salsilacus]|jgi:GntR family transcriptional repressor for pyruvate dehydrogenase complex|tara:strand:+ start:4924 stop:5625 length:702 start_codon:yes stop_codon:yes gene_type:complete